MGSIGGGWRRVSIPGQGQGASAVRVREEEVGFVAPALVLVLVPAPVRVRVLDAQAHRDDAPGAVGDVWGGGNCPFGEVVGEVAVVILLRVATRGVGMAVGRGTDGGRGLAVRRSTPSADGGHGLAVRWSTQSMDGGQGLAVRRSTQSTGGGRGLAARRSTPSVDGGHGLAVRRSTQSTDGGPGLVHPAVPQVVDPGEGNAEEVIPFLCGLVKGDVGETESPERIRRGRWWLSWSSGILWEARGERSPPPAACSGPRHRRPWCYCPRAVDGRQMQ